MTSRIALLQHRQWRAALIWDCVSALSVAVFLGLCEEVICLPARFQFCPNNKEAAEMLPVSAESRADEDEQSARDRGVTAGSRVQASRGLKGKSNLKHASPTLLLWSMGVMMIFLPVIWEFGNPNNSFKQQKQDCLWWCHSEANLITLLETLCSVLLNT